MKIVNAKKILKKAQDEKYAIAHININNLEWTKAILTTAQATNSPIILGTSEGAVKYMGGFKTVVGMVEGMMVDLEITVPVVLHLDHGSFEGAKAALKAGYSSIMFDGSHYPFAENLAKTKEILKLAEAKNASLEVEIGTLGGEEDGVTGQGELADPNEAKTISSLNIDMLAAGIGNIHGQYPPNWKGLSFDTLAQVKDASNIPLVLHGGTGIPLDQIQKAISLGVCKINVNTELQLAFANGVRSYIEAKKDLDMKAKGFDPRKLLADGFKAMQDVVKKKLIDFGSLNKA